MDTDLQGDDANLTSVRYACFMDMCVHALPSGIDVMILCTHCASDVHVEAVYSKITGKLTNARV